MKVQVSKDLQKFNYEIINHNVCVYILNFNPRSNLKRNKEENTRRINKICLAQLKLLLLTLSLHISFMFIDDKEHIKAYYVVTHNIEW